MKNKFYTSLTILSIFGCTVFTSCEDLLDTKSPSSIEDTDIFSNKSLVEGAINNIYTYYGEQNYRARYLPYYGLNTDIEWYNSSDKGDAKAGVVTFSALPGNTEMNIADSKEPWSNIYSGIEKANLAIKGLETSADMEDSFIQQLYGEALTLRAMAYVDLINAWGDVPARFEPVSTATVYTPRTDKYIIYKQLIKDLQTAEKLVAWPNETATTSTVERINKAFVKGMLARVCLQAAGYSLTADGTCAKSTDPELDKSVLYPIALQACKDVMDQEGKSVALKENFQDIFEDICRDVVKAGSESLWEIPYANDKDNERKGIVKERTDEFSTLQQELHLNFMSTHPDSYRQLKDNPSLVAEIVRQEQALNGSVVTYFPKDQLSYPPYKLNIKDGDILAITTNITGLDVVHVGFVCWVGDTLHLLHASSVAKKVILDPQPMYDYSKDKRTHTGVRIISVL